MDKDNSNDSFECFANEADDQGVESEAGGKKKSIADDLVIQFISKYRARRQTNNTFSPKKKCRLEFIIQYSTSFFNFHHILADDKNVLYHCKFWKPFTSNDGKPSLIKSLFQYRQERVKIPFGLQGQFCHVTLIYSLRSWHVNARSFETVNNIKVTRAAPRFSNFFNWQSTMADITRNIEYHFGNVPLQVSS